MYRPNDALINGQRLHNLFNTQDNAWHDMCKTNSQEVLKATYKPFRRLEAYSRSLDYDQSLGDRAFD